MANINDERYLRLRNGKFVKGIKANGEETNLFKINSSDKFEFVENPEVGGSPLQTQIQVEAKIQVTEIALQNEIDVVDSALSQEIQDRVSGDAATLQSAQSYTDSKVAEAKQEILGGIDDATLDTIKEVADRLKDEEELSSIILTGLADKQTQIDALASEAEGFVKLDGSRVMTGNLDFGTVDGQFGTYGAMGFSVGDSFSIAHGEEVIATYGSGQWTVVNAQKISEMTNPDAQGFFSFQLVSGISSLTVTHTSSLSYDATSFQFSVGVGFNEFHPSYIELVPKIYGYKVSGIEEGSNPNDAVNYAQFTRELGLVESALESADQAIQDSLTQEISDREAGDAATLLSAQGYADGLASGINSDISNLESGLAQEIVDRQSGDAATLSSAQNYADGLATSLQGNIDVEKARIDAILLASDADKDSFAEIVSLINSVDAENDSAFAGYVLSNNAAVEALEGRLDVIEPKVSTLETEMDTAKADILAVDAKVDQEILDRQSAVSALDGRVVTLEGKMTVAEGQISDLESDLASEEGRAIAAESALEARIEVLEGKTDGPFFGKVKRTLSSVLTYIDLDHEAVSGSINLVIARTPMFEGEDYDLSVVGGVSRLTFKGDFASNGPLAPESGDILNCNYAYIP